MTHAGERWLPLAAFAFAIAAAIPLLRPLPPPALTPPAQLPTAARSSAMESRFLPNPAPSAHSVSLVMLGGGNVGAAWFAGSREGAADVRVVFARFDGHEWSPAKSIAERVQVQRDAWRLVRKVGNPVIWRDATGTLHLWFVSVGYGGWGGSALNHIQSGDGGLTWSRAERLITSPFFNISTLGRGAPLALADSGIALPVYHEFIAKRPEWLRLSAQGKVVDKQRLPGAGALLQPSAVALDDQRILAVLRDAGSAHRIRVAQSTDAGSHWSDATVTQLPNPNAGIALLRLADGRLLLASNPQEAGRNLLALQVSGDEGRTWSSPRFIEQGGADDEYSYPALLQDETGMIHLAYTWRREKIRHLRFGPLALAEPKR